MAISERKDFYSYLKDLAYRKKPPEESDILPVVQKTVEILDSEPEYLRPADVSGNPGGAVLLDRKITIIVPDLHARRGFLLALLKDKADDEHSLIRLLDEGKAQIVCVGDGFHAEGRARKRWADAFQEYAGGYSVHKAMDSEMAESMGLMQMVMELKLRYPNSFYFLKGNHENIANEQGEGNYPFGKFAYEGEMVRHYMNTFYTKELFLAWYRFEKRLPLFCIGENFLISHAEPKQFFPLEEIINYRSHPEVVYGLTWTADEASEPGAVSEMITHYLERSPFKNLYYFGGHRPVHGSYNLRAAGRYVQIHNPDKYVVARIMPGVEIDLDEDIRVLNKNRWKEEKKL